MTSFFSSFSSFYPLSFPSLKSIPTPSITTTNLTESSPLLDVPSDSDLDPDYIFQRLLCDLDQLDHLRLQFQTVSMELQSKIYSTRLCKSMVTARTEAMNQVNQVHHSFQLVQKLHFKQQENKQKEQTSNTASTTTATSTTTASTIAVPAPPGSDNSFTPAHLAPFQTLVVQFTQITEILTQTCQLSIDLEIKHQNYTAKNSGSSKSSSAEHNSGSGRHQQSSSYGGSPTTTQSGTDSSAQIRSSTSDQDLSSHRTGFSPNLRSNSPSPVRSIGASPVRSSSSRTSAINSTNAHTRAPSSTFTGNFIHTGTSPLLHSSSPTLPALSSPKEIPLFDLDAMEQKQNAHTNNSSSSGPQFYPLQQVPLTSSSVSSPTSTSASTSTSSSLNHDLDITNSVGPLIVNNLAQSQLHNQLARQIQLSSLHQQVLQVASLYSEIHSLLLKQDESLNSMELNVSNTQLEVESAEENLNKASRLKAVGLTVLGGVIGSMVFGVPGALIGAKTALGMTTGAGVMGASGALVGLKMGSKLAKERRSGGGEGGGGKEEMKQHTSERNRADSVNSRARSRESTHSVTTNAAASTTPPISSAATSCTPSTSSTTSSSSSMRKLFSGFSRKKD